MKTLKPSSDPLKEKTLLFAVRIINLNRYLTMDKKEFVIARQIARSGTNPGAMVREAANAQSGLDFIHKLSIAQKETAETQYWLELLWKTNFLNDGEYNSLLSDTEEIMKLLRSSILTRKKNLVVKQQQLHPQ